MTTEFFIFGLARLTRICNPSTDSETSLKLMRYWKFSQKTNLKQFFFTDSEKEVGIFFKTGTIVKRLDRLICFDYVFHFNSSLKECFGRIRENVTNHLGGN